MRIPSTRLLLITFVFSIVSMAVVSPALSVEDPAAKKSLELRKALESRIEKILSDKKAFARMRDEGKLRTILCKTCHGNDGIAVKELTPNLAGQNPVYIVDQFQRFADGRRYDYLMTGLAKSFSDEDKIKIALYYSTLPMKPSGGGHPDLKDKGAQLFVQVCAECHGADGKGQEGYARLAGQRPDYVVKMLKEFKHRTGRRINPWMSGVALRLSDEDMLAVATYVAGLK